MASYGKYAPWHISILVTFWVLQLLFLAFELVIVIVALVVIGRNPGTYSTATIASSAVDLVLVVVSVVMTCYECILLARRRLTPLLYLIFNSVKTAIWIALLTTAVVLNSQTNNDGPRYSTTISNGTSFYYGRRYSYSPIVIILTIALVLLFALPVIYAIIIFLRHKMNRGTYNGITRQDPELPGAIPMNTQVNTVYVPGTQSAHGFYAPAAAPMPYAPEIQPASGFYAPPHATNQHIGAGNPLSSSGLKSQLQQQQQQGNAPPVEAFRYR